MGIARRLLLAPLALGACVSAPVEDQARLAQGIEARLAAGPVLSGQDADPAVAAARVEAMLSEPLDEASAMRLALANNPRVAAAFDGLGVAYADYLGAVLPPNPVASVMRLTPEDGPGDMLKTGVSIDLLRLIAWPAQAAAGKARRDAARAAAAGEVLSVAARARLALIDYVALRQQACLMAQAKEAADAAAVAAEAIFAAGNSAAVDRDQERLFAAEVDLAHRHAEARLAPARERLIAALGLTRDQAARLTTIERLPPPPTAALNLAAIEAEAVAASADLALAAGAVRAARAQSGVVCVTSLLPGLGLEFEREREDGEVKERAGVDLRLPIFGLGGADRLRSAAQERRLGALQEALERELRAEARALGAEAESARALAVHYRETILPLSAAQFEGLQRDFNAMELGVLDLLHAKRARLESGRQAVAAVGAYWAAQARLDILRAGGRSAPVTASVAPGAVDPHPAAPADPGH